MCIVPRFFLHVFDDIETIDEEGQEFDDVWAAREAALEGARDLVCEQIRAGYLNLDGHIQIASERGEQLMRVSFR